MSEESKIIECTCDGNECGCDIEKVIVETAHIEYEDFKKIDMKIGLVTAAERVEDTDKLIKCQVDFGDEFGIRQIVSGIAEYVAVEDLVGKKFPYVLNLAPRTIRGVESQGMILATGGHGKPFGLLSPHNDDVELGSQLS